MSTVDRAFGEKFLTSIDDFDAYGVHLLFNDWWEKAPQDVIDKYVAAIENHPEQGPLAAEGWLSEPVTLASLEHYGTGTLGAAYLDFMIKNNLVEKLAQGYRDLHDEIASEGRLDRMPDIIRYKVLRGFQTHDMHHVLTGYDATPFGELALQAFGLAQMNYPYAGMWMAVVTSHMTYINPDLMTPAMDAISEGWQRGRNSRSIQFTHFEKRLGEPLEALQREYGLSQDDVAPTARAAQ